MKNTGVRDLAESYKQAYEPVIPHATALSKAVNDALEYIRQYQVTHQLYDIGRFAWVWEVDDISVAIDQVEATGVRIPLLAEGFFEYAFLSFEDMDDLDAALAAEVNDNDNARLREAAIRLEAKNASLAGERASVDSQLADRY